MSLIGRLGNSTISAWFNHVFLNQKFYSSTDKQMVMIYQD